jgi:serine/threonine protein kinase
VLVLEDPGGVPLDQSIGPTRNASAAADSSEQQSDLAFHLRLAIGLSDAIEQLHQRGIIHKDIKPANILVNSQAALPYRRKSVHRGRVPL